MVASTSNLITSPAARAIKRRFRHLWKRYLRWPVPLWRAQGFARLDLAGHEFKFRVATPALWWLKQLHEGKWQKGVMQFLKDTLQPGDVYFDIGPWIGIYTLLPAKLVAPDGRVYAFEPDTLARRLLGQNLAANRLSNVTVLPYAVTDREGSARFEAGKGTSEGKVMRSGGDVEVQTVTLKNFCEKHNVYPSAIKISAEGQEPKILAGAAGVLRKTRVIILEFHRPRLCAAGEDPSEYFQSLFNLGRRVILLYELSRDGLKPGTELTKQYVPADYTKLALL